MTKKRFAVALFDLACCAVLALYFAAVCVTPAYAYVDPSVMTYAIQAFAGVAVALGAVAGVALRRTRKVLFKALNIDENARKDVEADVHRLDDDGNPIGLDDSPAAAPRKKRAKSAAALRWPTRLVYAAIVSVFFVFTIFVVAPYEIVAANSVDLVFGLPSVWSVIAVAAVVLAAVVALMVSALRGKAFNVVLLVVFSLGLAAYVQALFMNGALPAADGRAVAWDEYTTITVVSAVVWAGIVALPLVLSHWFGGAVRGLAAALSVCLVIVQGVGVASLFVDEAYSGASGGESAAAAGPAVMTQEGLFDVSPKDNVIVFVLDTYDTGDMDELLASKPEALDEFTGFTYFHDATGMYIPTRYAVPYLLTGYSYLDREPDDWAGMQRFMDDRYEPATFLEGIRDSGYSIGLYTDSFMQADSGAEALTMNIHPQAEPAVDAWGTVSVLWKCALYRDMPWALKPPFWFWTDQINNGMVDKEDLSAVESLPYTMDDAAYYDSLRDVGLSVKDTGDAGSFRFIHLSGAHEPYTMDENGVTVGDGNSSRAQQCEGAMKIVAEYLAQLKKIGAYDNSTIIVTADHGYYIPEEVEMDVPSCPLMLVKPAGQTTEEASAPWKISEAPTGHLDFQATVYDAIGRSDYQQFGGIPMLEVPEDAERLRYYYLTTTDWNQDVSFREYEIDGPALDFSNWAFTGRYWQLADPSTVDPEIWEELSAAL